MYEKEPPCSLSQCWTNHHVCFRFDTAGHLASKLLVGYTSMIGNNDFWLISTNLVYLKPELNFSICCVRSQRWLNHSAPVLNHYNVLFIFFICKHFVFRTIYLIGNFKKLKNLPGFLIFFLPNGLRTLAMNVPNIKTSKRLPIWHGMTLTKTEKASGSLM